MGKISGIVAEMVVPGNQIVILKKRTADAAPDKEYRCQFRELRTFSENEFQSLGGFIEFLLEDVELVMGIHRGAFVDFSTQPVYSLLENIGVVLAVLGEQQTQVFFWCLKLFPCRALGRQDRGDRYQQGSHQCRD